MAVELASAYIQLIPSLRGAQGAIAKELGGAGKAGAGSFNAGFGSALKPLAGLAIAGLGIKKLTGFIGDSIAAVGNWQALNAQSASAVKATGGAANVTAKQVNALAQSLEGQTATQAESIQQGANLLLTFRGVRNEAGKGNDIFNQTTAAAVDMARAMGTDVSSSALQLGKALNDPAQGLTKLTRSGVTFTDQQKAQIKALQASGDKLGAQKIILKELNSEFGGSGAAYAKTYEGALYAAGDAVGDFGEKIATVAMPAITSLLGTATRIVNWATNSGVIEKTAAAISTAFHAVQGGIAAFVTGLGLGTGAAQSFGAPLNGLAAVGATVGTALSGIGKAIGPSLALVGSTFVSTFGGIAATVAPLMGPLVTAFAGLIGPALQLLPALSPLGLVFQALAPVLPVIAGLITQLATVLSGVLAQAAAVIVPIIGTLVSTLSGVFVAILPTVALLLTAVGNAVALLAPVLLGVVAALAPLIASLAGSLAPILIQLVTSVLPPIITIFSAIVAAIVPLITIIAGLLIPIIQALLPVVVAVFGALVPIISAALQIVMGVIQVVTGIITGNWKQVWAGLGNIVGGAWNLIVSVIRGAIGIVLAVIKAVISIIGSIWSGLWKLVVSAATTGVGNAIKVVTGIKDGVVGAIKGAATWLVDSGKAIIQGLIDGITGMIGAVGDAVGGVMDFIGGFFPHSPAKRGPFSGSGWTAVGKSGAALAEQFTGGFNASVDPTFNSRGLKSTVNAKTTIGGGSGQPIYTDHGVLFGMIKTGADGVARLIIDQQHAAEERVSRLGMQPAVLGA